MTATLLDLPSRAFSFEQRETYLFTVVLSLVAVWFFLPGPALGADAAPAGSSGVTAPSPADAAPSGDSTSQPQRFYIRKFRVDGTRGINGAPPILSRAEVEAVIYPFMGPYRTNQDVEDARAALERAYQAKGYQTVSVQTPDQSMTDVLKKGVIVLKVTQMPVGRLRVVGSRYYLPSDIKAQAPSLAEGSVPNFNEVTKDIVSLNQLPDRQVTPALHPGITPGTIDFDLNVKDKLPLHGSVEVNNRYSADTTPLRLTASMDYDNLWQLGHSISATYQVAPEDPRDAQVFSGSYLARIPGLSWLSFLLYGLKSDSDVSTIGSTNVAGRGDVIGGRMLISLPADKGFFQSISLGVDYKKFDQVVSFGGTSTSTETPVTYFPLSATYSATWQGGDGSLTQLDSGVTLNLRGVAGSSEVAFDEDRYGASGNFIYFRGDLSRMQPLPKDFQLYGKVQAQLADEALVSSEQVSGGGLDTVRGYLESEEIGDNGMIGQFEARTPSLGQFYPAVIDDWRIYVFGDAAELGLNNTLPQQQTTFNLASIGFGSRIKLFDHCNGSADVAMPLITGADTVADHWRITLRAEATF